MNKRAARRVGFAFLLTTALVACANGGGGSAVPQAASVSTGGVTPWPSGSPPFPSSSPSPTATPSGGVTATPASTATPTPSGGATTTPSPTATPANTPTPTPTGSSVPIHIPIPTPTPAPTTPPTLSSSPFFPSGGSGDCASGLTLTVSPQQLADVTISEPNYTGTWSVQSNTNSSVASASISGNILTITALTVGTTTVQVADQAGNASPCHVTTQ